MKFIIVIFLLVVTTLCVAAPIENAAFNDKSVRAAKVKELREKAEREKAEVVEWAEKHDFNIHTVVDGRVIELMRIDSEGRPVFYTTFNREAAISTGANLVREITPYNVDGSSLTVGVWDEGVAYVNHPEFGSPSRIHVKDNGKTVDHSTHVAGTIGAAGASSNAKGMAPKINIDAYNWSSDISEMASRGASSPNSPSEIHLSNHSYGLGLGWVDLGVWVWWDDVSVKEEARFGQYGYLSAEIDSLACDAPYYLIFYSAGNDRTDGPQNGEGMYWFDSNSGNLIPVYYNSNIHPKGDGIYKSGYDNLGPYACAKNALTVGAVNEAVSGSSRKAANGTMSTFSCWGPADDGRIKPDVVGNGVNVYSPLSNSYAAWNGTSMACPNVCGSAALLVELYKNLHSENAMRASSLKGLLIHTADDLGRPGPDYTFGWGLINTKAAADLIMSEVRPETMAKIIENQISVGAENEIQLLLKHSQTFKFTLCWTDPAGSSTSSHDDRTATLVNDLNLRIVNPDGITNLPFVLDVNNPSANATTGDNSIDNVEQIIIENAQTGTYKIIISYKNGSENQFYSLIAYSLAPPSTPINISPANNEENLSTIPQLNSSTFSDPDIYDYHLDSEWEVSFDNSFTNIVWQVDSDTTNIYVDFGYLNYSTQYFWRVRYSDNSNFWSEWSAPTSFKTVFIMPPNQPFNVLPTNNEENLSVTPTLQSSDFSDPNVSDSLSASKWQVSFDNNFSNIVWEGNSAATSVSVASGQLIYSTQYFWRVKHADKYNAWSDWSVATCFNTANISYFDSARITTAIIKSKKVLLKGVGLIFAEELKGEPVLVDFDGVNLFDFTDDWKNKKKSAKLKALDANYKGSAKISTAGKKTGNFLIKAKAVQKAEPVTGEHTITVTVGNKFFTNTLNFINGKYKE